MIIACFTGLLSTFIQLGPGFSKYNMPLACQENCEWWDNLGYLLFKRETQKFQMKPQMVCAIPFTSAVQLIWIYFEVGSSLVRNINRLFPHSYK